MSEKIDVLQIKKDFFKKPFVNDRIFVPLFFLGLVSNVILLITLFFGIKVEDKIIQTRFDSFYGVTATGDWQDIYFFYFVGLIVLISNSLLAAYAFKKEKIIAYILLSITFLVHLILFFEALSFIKLINI